jgi:diacylglycerol kinase
VNILKMFINLWTKFKVAFEGLFFGLFNDSSIQLQFVLGLVVVVLIILLPLETFEVIILLLLIGLILALEYINTSIEWICDALIPQENADVKRIKDLASAAVLFMSLFAASIALIILIPHIKEILG